MCLPTSGGPLEACPPVSEGGGGCRRRRHWGWSFTRGAPPAAHGPRRPARVQGLCVRYPRRSQTGVERGNPRRVPGGAQAVSAHASEGGGRPVGGRPRMSQVCVDARDTNCDTVAEVGGGPPPPGDTVPDANAYETIGTRPTRCCTAHSPSIVKPTSGRPWRQPPPPRASSRTGTHGLPLLHRGAGPRAPGSTTTDTTRAFHPLPTRTGRAARALPTRRCAARLARPHDAGTWHGSGGGGGGARLSGIFRCRARRPNDGTAAHSRSVTRAGAPVGATAVHARWRGIRCRRCSGCARGEPNQPWQRSHWQIIFDRDASSVPILGVGEFRWNTARPNGCRSVSP